MKSLIKKELLITIFFVSSGLTLGQGLKSKGSMGAGLPERATLDRKVGLISKENNKYLMQKA